MAISFDSNYSRDLPFFAEINPPPSAARRSKPAFLSASVRRAPGRHLARFLKGIHRACLLAAAVRRGFALHDHILV
jgi:hypothetical protein